MQTKVFLRRGTSEVSHEYTPSQGEVIYITDKQQLRIGDGNTPAGHLVVGTILMMSRNESLPREPRGFRQWLLKLLGVKCEYGFAYYPHNQTVWRYDRKDRRWRQVMERRLCIIPASAEFKLNGKDLTRFCIK